MKRRILGIILLVFSGNLLFAQQMVTGLVVTEDETELIGCSVVVLNPSDGSYTAIGTATDLNGRFSLKISDFPVRLAFFYVGCERQEITINKAEDLKVVMELSYDFSIIETPLVLATPINLTMPTSFFKLEIKELQRDADLSISPILNRVPGVYMHSGALNTNRITMRGIGNRSLFSTTKIRAYLDDIPLTTGDGETTIEDIDLSIVDHVKIWKGPTASTYGAGLGGMIHLQTRKPWNQAEESYVASKMTLGSYGLIRNATDLYLANKKNTADLRLNYNKTHSDGYRDNNQYDRSAWTLLGKVKNGKKHETTLLANFTKVKAFIPSSLNRSDYENEPEKAAFTWGSVKGFEDYEKVLIGLSHQSRWKNFGDYSLGNTTSVFTRFGNAYESRPFNILQEENQSLGVRTSFELNRDNRIAPNFAIGLEAFSENYKWQTFVTNEGSLGNLLSDNQEDRKYINLFAQAYTPIGEHWTLMAGANLNHTIYSYQDQFDQDSIDLSGDYSFDWILSPRLGLTYRFENSLNLFATVSHGFSPPTLEETLTPEGAINPAIQPEQGWNFEMGARGKLFYKFAYELTVYQMEIKDLLVAQRVGPDQFVGVNAGATRHFGIETFLTYRILANRHKLSAFSTYTFNNYTFQDFVDEGNDYSGNQLTGTAPHQLNLGLDYSHHQGFYGNINFQYVDAFPMRDDNAVFSEAYQVMHSKIGFRKKIKDQLELDIFTGIRNLLNEKYASMILINAGSFGGNAPRYYYPGLPRNYFGGVALKWSF